MSKLIATVFGVGYLKPGPGTWGSLISLPFFWLTYDIIGLIGSIIVGVILFFIGWKAIEVYSRKTQTHDASEVIIDEVVGQFIALLQQVHQLNIFGQVGSVPLFYFVCLIFLNLV